MINGDLNKRTRRHCCISVSAYVGNKFVLQDRKRNKKMPQIKKTMRTMDLKQEHFHRLSSAPANGGDSAPLEKLIYCSAFLLMMLSFSGLTCNIFPSSVLLEPSHQCDL